MSTAVVNRQIKIGWLTFVSPELARSLSPYNYYPGGIGEISLCLWLLVIGVNAERWKEQASGTAEIRRHRPS